MQHYGLASVWENGDIVTRCILSALLVMSVLLVASAVAAYVVSPTF